MKRKFLTLTVVLTGWIICAGCSQSPKALNLAVDNKVKVPEKRAIVFLVDGMRADLTREMLADGELPNIKKYLVDRGCTVENGVSCIPSITYAAIASINTGRFPGHHDVMGNKWFDRVSGQFRDYMHPGSYQKVDPDVRARTIYEVLEDKYTVTIQTSHRRGADRTFDNWMSSGIRWFMKDYSGVDKLVGDRFDQIRECAGATGHWPDFIMAYFPGLDEIGHRYGSDSEAYRKEMRNLDDQIGRVCDALEASGMLEKYYMVLISDHGHDPMKPQCRWLPEPYFEGQLNIPTLNHRFMKDGNSYEWHKYLKNYRLVYINGGTRRMHIHLRGDDSWIDEPSFGDVEHFLERYYPATYEKMGKRDLLYLLSQETGIGIVTAKINAETVLVLSAKGCSQVSRRIKADGSKDYAYQVIANDPLGYLGYEPTAKLMDGKFHDSRCWLNASCGSEYPDFVPQIVEMFDSHRAGQIVVFASHGWTFSTKDRSGHGSVIREDMIVPFIIAGPGICRRTLPTARQVDIMPTILDVLGDLDKMKAAGPIDGISLLPLLTSTQPVCSQPTTTATRPTTRAATQKVRCLTTYPVTQPATRATTQTRPSSLPASQAVR